MLNPSPPYQCGRTVSTPRANTTCFVCASCVCVCVSCPRYLLEKNPRVELRATYLPTDGLKRRTHVKTALKSVFGAKFDKVVALYKRVAAKINRDNITRASAVEMINDGMP